LTGCRKSVLLPIMNENASEIIMYVQ